jgi:hypothetical protein
MKMKNPASPDHQVGYRCPPKEHQFQPGQSGNPSGRPKGSRSLKTELLEELREVVSVADVQGTVEVSKARAVVKTLIRLAIAGDSRAIATVMSSSPGLGEDDGNAEFEAPEDQHIMSAVAVHGRDRETAVPPKASSPSKRDVP